MADEEKTKLDRRSNTTAKASKVDETEEPGTDDSKDEAKKAY